MEGTGVLLRLSLMNSTQRWPRGTDRPVPPWPASGTSYGFAVRQAWGSNPVLLLTDKVPRATQNPRVSVYLYVSGNTYLLRFGVVFTNFMRIRKRKCLALERSQLMLVPANALHTPRPAQPFWVHRTCHTHHRAESRVLTQMGQ